MVGRPRRSTPLYSSAASDVYKRQASQALRNAGYRRIACITGPANIETASERAEGWMDAMGADYSPDDAKLLIYSSFRVDGGREAMARLLALDPPPDAVVA